MPNYQWFARRRYGFGVRPTTWQGWLITALGIAGVIGALVGVKKTTGDILLVGVVGLYLAVAYSLGGTKKLVTVDGHTENVDGNRTIEDVATPAPVPKEIYGSQTPHAIAEAIVSHTGKFADAGDDVATGDSVIVVKGLTKQFGQRVAFEDVTFSVRRGEVFGFLGPNGAGKTSTVRTLSTLVAPTAGTAEVAGIPLDGKHDVEIRQRIAVMTEVPGLYLRLSVTENLVFFAGLYGYRDAQPRIDRALEAVNLSSRANDLCGSLSKGLRQRVGLARALLNDPEILFLDEPTAGLDPVASLEVHNLINALRVKGVTVFLTTHRLDEAEKLCDRVAILNTTLRTVGRIDDLRQRMFHKSILVSTITPLADPDRVIAALDCVTSWSLDDTGGYVLVVNDVRVAAPKIAKALVEAGADILSLVEGHHSLEEVYLELVGAAGQRGA
ncbi:MAG TPA: ABC transporter ATP-binding protein, partial [Acidimicrobiales bacterium]